MSSNDSTDSSTTTTQRTSAVPVERFVADFLDVTDALQLWARLRIREGLRPRLDPEDIVQETCVRAYSDYARFDPDKGSFRAWVFGIATHVLLKQLRALGRQGVAQPVVLPGEAEIEAVLDSVSSITSKIARREALAAVLDEIQHLDREERWLLIYRGLEQLEFAEVGDRLGLHPEAARARWRRLLEQLRRRPSLSRFLV